MSILPEVLNIQVQRFSFNYHTETTEKNKFSFEYSKKISIKSKYLTKELKNSLKNKQERIISNNTYSFKDTFSQLNSDVESDYYSDPSDSESDNISTNQSLVTYSLESVILHHGEEACGGHYTTLVKDSRNQWLHMNDDQVREVNEDDVTGPLFREQVYLLFYSKD